MYEAPGPLDNEEVKALYSHTAWQSPQDDPFAAEVIHLLHALDSPRCISHKTWVLCRIGR